MAQSPRPPGCPGGAVGSARKSGLEPRFSKALSPKNQFPAFLRRQRHIETICRTPRVVSELLRAIGADVFPAAPLFALEGGQ